MPEQIFEKYEKFRMNNCKLLNSNEIIIDCPAPGCETKFVIWKDADFTTCPGCKFPFCVYCK